MKIGITAVLVDDQEKALEFYTKKLGFVKKADVRNAGYRWLTVASPEEDCDIQLLLEPMGLEAAKNYQKALHDAGAPMTMFGVADVEKEYNRLRKLGVEFKSEPMKVPGGKAVMFEDTCGNLIQINDVGQHSSEKMRSR